jgi:hypothetical protein
LSVFFKLNTLEIIEMDIFNFASSIVLGFILLMHSDFNVPKKFSAGALS